VGTVAGVNATATTVAVDGAYCITANRKLSHTTMVIGSWYHMLGLKSDSSVIAMGWDD